MATLICFFLFLHFNAPWWLWVLFVLVFLFGGATNDEEVSPHAKKKW